MQAITTYFLPPTNYRGARIVARASAGRMVFSWQYAMNADENHDYAAALFAIAKNWPNHLVSGQTHSGEYAHVMLTSYEPGEGPQTTIDRLKPRADD